MKKSILWKIVLLIGVLPFVIPIFGGLYSVSVESWNLFDWLLMYSFLYWPTYLIGAVLIGLAVWKITRGTGKSNE